MVAATVPAVDFETDVGAPFPALAALGHPALLSPVMAAPSVVGDDRCGAQIPRRKNRFIVCHGSGLPPFAWRFVLSLYGV